MESLPLEEVLNCVKDILAGSPLTGPAPNTKGEDQGASRILPQQIPDLPRWVQTLPEGTLPLSRVIERLSNDIVPYLNASSLSPRYYGFVTGGATPAALIADIIATIFDQNVAVHLPKETIATTVEVAALNMLVDLFQLPVKSWAIGTSGNGGGIVTTGATASNVLGLALGREHVLAAAALRETGDVISVGEHGLFEVSRRGNIDTITILSTMPHSSIAKAASIVGIGRSNVKSIARADDPLSVDLERLRTLADEARVSKTAYILAISAGEVNTGRFATCSHGEMADIRRICDEHDIWIHVDGAFGLFGRVLANCAAAQDFRSMIDGTQGLELADSITGDGHKLLNVPYDCGLFFTRHKRLSEDVFGNGGAAYLTSSAQQGSVQSPLNVGIENSRRFRALPIYSTLSAYGRAGYVDMLSRQIGLARNVTSWIWERDDLQLLPVTNSKEEALSKTFMIVLFRALDDELNSRLVREINASGKIYVTGTQWSEKPATRIAVSNWRVDIDEDWPVIRNVLENILA